jgi:hypothetical protein
MEKKNCRDDAMKHLILLKNRSDKALNASSPYIVVSKLYEAMLIFQHNSRRCPDSCMYVSEKTTILPDIATEFKLV